MISWRGYIKPIKPANEDETFSISYDNSAKVLIRFDITGQKFCSFNVDENEFTRLVEEYLRVKDAINPKMIKLEQGDEYV